MYLSLLVINTPFIMLAFKYFSVLLAPSTLLKTQQALDGKERYLKAAFSQFKLVNKQINKGLANKYSLFLAFKLTTLHWR